MNTADGKGNFSEPQKEDKNDENIEWDNENATYGHVINQSGFKRKDLPTEEHMRSAEQVSNDKIHSDLSNAALSDDVDAGTRNAKNEKAIKGDE